MRKLNDVEMSEMYPTPIATSWLRCRSCRRRAEYSAAVQHLAVVTLQTIQMLVTGVKRSLVKTTAATTPSDGFESPLPWGTAESVFRVLEDVRPHVPRGWLPTRCKVQSYPFLRGLSGGVGAPQPTHFLEALELLGQPSALLNKGEPSFSGANALFWNDSTQEAALWSFLTRLITIDLAFLRQWRLIAVLNDSPSASPDADDVIELQGPLVKRKKMTLARRLTKGHVYGLPKNGAPLSLHPFGIYTSPTFLSAQTNGDKEVCCRLPEELLLLSFHDSQNVRYRGCCTGFSMLRNDLTALVNQARFGASMSLVRRWPNVCWGYACLNVDKMRDLNDAVGFPAGDQLLASLDQSAAAIASDLIPPAPCGAPKLFPFWSEADTLLMPFTYAPSLTPSSGLVPLLMATLSKMLEAALRDWKCPYSPRFNVLIDPLVWQQGEPLSQPFGHAVMDSVEALRHRCKALRLQEPREQCPVLWLTRNPHTGACSFNAEQEFRRTSTAAFGLIRRQVKKNDWQFLLCWNPTHGGLNFPGGHMEKQDAGNPRLTMARELWEELGLTVDATEAKAVFDGPLRALRESMRNQPRTAYAHYFYLLDGQKLSSLANASTRWQWVTVAELLRGATTSGTPIRPFPHELLRPFLAKLPTVVLPLSAAENSDCSWTTIPPSALES